ncbi:MAG: glycosyltransferase [Candidatus Lokiarchaeota archaeon]|nr:glycosyltransferase [Candidatus Lokiarchaeota archaeon]
MVKSIDDYYDIVGPQIIAEIHKKARKLYGKHIVHINSTFQGGGVAEMLLSLIPLMNDINVTTGWRVLHGNPDFYTITKKFHNGLQGEDFNFSDIKQQLYLETNEDFSQITHLDHDCVIIHDPQPLPIIKFFKKQQPWIWRCHVDLTSPHQELWEFLKHFIVRYDHMIVSNEQYKKEDIPIPQHIICPAIDPLDPKNKEIDSELIDYTLEKFEIPNDKPIITQVSRFDKWKDPINVLKIFKNIKKKIDCRLVLCGSLASDDPEGVLIYEQVKEAAGNMLENKDVILTTVENDILVNAIQSQSSVIIQKSLREGFGLTITEALWKSKPVVASKVGGVPIQITNGKDGFLFDPMDLKGFENKIIELIEHPDLAVKIGKNARDKVKKNFLITRQIVNYLDLLDEFINN